MSRTTHKCISTETPVDRSEYLIEKIPTGMSREMVVVHNVKAEILFKEVYLHWDWTEYYLEIIVDSDPCSAKLCPV